MLTIFSWPGPLDGGALEMIQRSAVESWLKLSIKPRIILLGDEKGVAEFCREKELEHHPREKGREGKASIQEVFRQGTLNADPKALYAYVAPDLLLNDDFGVAASFLERSVDGLFLATGEVHELEVTEELHGRKDFHEAQKLVTGGIAQPPEEMDYFLFTPQKLPEFPLLLKDGNLWREWLIWSAISLRVPVIDLSSQVVAVRLCSGATALQGEVTEEEIRFVGGKDHLCNLRDADYLFQDGELAKNRSVEYYERRFLHPLLALKNKMYKPITFKPREK